MKSKAVFLAGIASAVSLGGWSVGSTAQAVSMREMLALQQRLSAATRLECSFPALATGAWTDGAPALETRQKALKVVFHGINVDEGTAEADSQFGEFYVVVRYSNGYLHLVQMFASGPLYTTTVLAQETADGRMMAIHTRHEYTPATVPGFTSRPEMYLGDCVVGE